LELREYLLESRVPFALNPRTGYDRRKVGIDVPSGFDLLTFGRDITYRGVREHLAHIFDGYDLRETLLPFKEAQPSGGL